jgi:hypothetical protein
MAGPPTSASSSPSSGPVTNPSDARAQAPPYEGAYDSGSYYDVREPVYSTPYYAPLAPTYYDYRVYDYRPYDYYYGYYGYPHPWWWFGTSIVFFDHDHHHHDGHHDDHHDGHHDDHHHHDFDRHDFDHSTAGAHNSGRDRVRDRSNMSGSRFESSRSTTASGARTSSSSGRTATARLSDQCRRKTGRSAAAPIAPAARIAPAVPIATRSSGFVGPVRQPTPGRDRAATASPGQSCDAGPQQQQRFGSRRSLGRSDRITFADPLGTIAIVGRRTILLVRRWGSSARTAAGVPRWQRRWRSVAVARAVAAAATADGDLVPLPRTP